MSKKIQDLENDQAPATPEELAALNAAKDETIAELLARLAQLEKEKAAGAKAGGPVVTIDEKQYQVVHGLRFRGEVKTPADIAADPDACRELLSENSSCLKPL